jgi:DNA-binding transcriptional regulator YiaG
METNDAELVRSIRGRRSREEFARLLGISAKTIERWEHGAKLKARDKLALLSLEEKSALS